jgi:hypothetical protein
VNREAALTRRRAVYRDVTTEIAEIKRKARVVAAVGVLIGGVVPGLLGIAAMSTAERPLVAP